MLDKIQAVVVRDLVGVLFDVPGKELAEHFKERSAYHQERAGFFEKQLSEVERAKMDFDVVQQDRGYSNRSVSNVKTELEEQMRVHKDKARFFKWASSHVDPKRVYVLKKDDLASSELFFT